VSRIVFRERKPRSQVDLNVTSLVDVLFLLLIFFTLTSTFKRAGELELQLPESTTAGPAAATARPVQLVLTEHGTLMLDGTPTTFDQLLPKLRAVHARQPNDEVMIEAEQGVAHGQVVRLLDAVRSAGFTGVGIGVRTPVTPAGATAPPVR
jgi:biopolymer transport protein ExbD